MRKLLKLVALSGLVLGAIFVTAMPATAQQSQQANYTDLTALPYEDRLQQVRCRVLQPTGTNLYMHVCMTVEDWSEMRERNRVQLESLIQTGTEIGT